MLPRPQPEIDAASPMKKTRSTRVSLPAPYAAVTVELPERGTLLAFTDGLVERRGECIDIGLERVTNCLRTGHETLERLLDDLLERLQDGADDDTAMLGLQWNL